MLVKARRRIGIIGGMGPEATVLLMNRIIAATPVEDDGDHVPMIVDNNPQVPSRIRALIDGAGEDPGPVIAAMARRLEAYGAEALAMPCNTAHHFAGQIRASATVPFLDMIHLSVEAAAARSATGAIAILASPAVRVTRLFDHAFAGRPFSPRYMKDDAPLLALIQHIKVRGADHASRAELHRIAQELNLDGASIVLVACSELSLIADALPKSTPVIDTIDVLASACIQFSLQSSSLASDALRKPGFADNRHQTDFVAQQKPHTTEK